MQDAQRYLATVLPWPQEGDPPAFINIHWSTDKLDHKGKPRWGGYPARDVQQATGIVTRALNNPSVRDIYVCMSSQREAETKHNKQGKPFLVSKRNHANAVALKSLFMDIDAKGKDKDSYDTLEEAWSAFQDFLKAVGLPLPNVVVRTGGGVHVYWTFERALSVQDWQPLSNALAAAAVAHGLKFDTACTVDSVRVLRIPCTFNRKLANSRPVVLSGHTVGGDYLLARLEATLAPYVNLTPKVTANPIIRTATPGLDTWDAHHPRLPPINDADKLSSGVVEEKTDLKEIIAVCPFLKEAVTTGGKNFEGNMLWNLTTLIATMTEGGRLDAHVMCRGSTYYNKGDTDDLFERKSREHKEKGVGWPYCRTVANAGAKGCTGCVHLATDRSALHAAATVAAQASVASATAASGSGAAAGQLQPLPSGYKRRADNIICQSQTNDDGTVEDVPICRYPIFDGFLEEHPDYVLNFSTTFETGKTTQVRAKLRELGDKNAMFRCLGEQGITLQDDEAKHVRKFFVSWIKTLQEAKKIVPSVPFGWSNDSKGIEGFVYGGQLHNGGVPRQASNPDKVIGRVYTPRGVDSIAPWTAAAKLITDQKRPALDAIVASAFAAPLIKFCDEPGVLMSTYSTKSGIGKTSALKVAQSVWGNPIAGIQALDDTTNSLFKIVGQIRNLPVYWDELKTEEDTKRFVNVAFKLTGQKEKNRLNQNSTMKEGGTWNTMLVSVSNDSLMQFVVHQTKQTTAGINRIFEYEVPAAVTNLGQIDQADASGILGKINDNYGHVGLRYARYLGSKHDFISKDVAAAYKAIGIELNTTQEERYWRVMVACLLKGAEYANKEGFTNTIDEIALKEFLFKVVADLRAERSQSTSDLSKAINVTDILGHFLTAMHMRHTIFTDKIPKGRGSPAVNAIKITRNEQHLPGMLIAVNVQYATEDKLLRISKGYFQEWLRKNQHPVGAVLAAMKARFNPRDVQATLAAGTQYAPGTKMWLLEFDYAANPDLDPEV